MTTPSAGAPGVSQRGATPGESEFSWGKGLMAPPGRGYEPENWEVMQAIRQTETTNPNADHTDSFAGGGIAGDGNAARYGSTDELGVFTPGNLNSDATQMVREIGPSSSVGQHKRLNPAIARGGDPDHEPDGLQDGSGAAWRASLPPNPVAGQ